MRHLFVVVGVATLLIGCGIRPGTPVSDAVMHYGAPDLEAALPDGHRVLTWRYMGWFFASCRRNLLVHGDRVERESSDCTY